MDLPEYAGVLRRRWRWPVLLALLGLGIAVAWTATAGPVYRSTATLYYAEPTRNLTPAAARLTSFAILATSDQVLEQVLDDVRPTLGPRRTTDRSPAMLRERVHTTIDPETSILTVTATDSSPAGARAIAEQTARRLIALVDALRATPGAQGEGRLTLGDPATVAVDATAARTARSVALGGLLGLLIGILLALLRQAVDPRLLHADEVRRLAPRWQVLSLQEGDEQAGTTAAATRLRAVRTAIVDAPDRPRVLVVAGVEDGVRVSATHAAGSIDTRVATVTTIADAVAQGAARDGVNVVLLCAQIHPARAAVPVWALAEPGLIAVLRGERRLAEAVGAGPVPGLRLVPAGRTQHLPEAVLTSRPMRQVIDDLRTRSELLIVDAPPLSITATTTATTTTDRTSTDRTTTPGTPDTLGLVRAAQAGVLLVVRRGLRRSVVRALVRQVQTEGDQDDGGVRVLFLSPARSRRGRRGAPPAAERAEPPAPDPSPALAPAAAS